MSTFAFPQPIILRDGRVSAADDTTVSGMELRDYFAASVAAALIPVARQGASKGDDVAKMTAEFAYEVAAAMMEARKG